MDICLNSVINLITCIYYQYNQDYRIFILIISFKNPLNEAISLEQTQSLPLSEETTLTALCQSKCRADRVESWFTQISLHDFLCRSVCLYVVACCLNYLPIAGPGWILAVLLFVALDCFFVKSRNKSGCWDISTLFRLHAFYRLLSTYRGAPPETIPPKRVNFILNHNI